MDLVRLCARGDSVDARRRFDGENAEGVDKEKDGQFVIWLVYCARYATRGIPIAFVRELWRRYLANDVDYYVLPKFGVQDNVTTTWLDVESAVRGGARGAVDDVVEPMSIPENDNN